MLTIRAAAALLAQADLPAALHRVASALGFTDAPRPLPPPKLAALGIATLATDAWLTAGHGSLRLCTAILTPHDAHARTSDTRDLTRRLAAALARHAPLQRWCIITLDSARQSVCIATVTQHPAGPRVAALRVERAHVVDSDADTLRTLSSVAETDDTLRHARFTDILKRDNLSARFYIALERTVDHLARTAVGHASPAERHELALLCASRCLFLAFLQAKGWLDNDPDFLLHHCTVRLQLGGQLHERLLRPLFFGTLNTPRSKRAPAARTFGNIPFLNGGLFAPTALEKTRSTLRFTDDAVTSLVADLLDRYRFTAHEDSSAWSEAAIDPEMLGRAFECLMAGEERRKSGSFYTPPALVDQVVHDALHHAIPTMPAGALAPNALHLPVTLDARTREQISALRIIDPACGSGAFLVHILERLSDLLQRAGDTRPLHVIRRDTLTRSIFGVDCNPVAVWLCELRLWLSVVIECHETDPGRVPPLPNLDHNIRTGDTLAGGDMQHVQRAPRLVQLRERYARATGTRKQALGRTLAHIERRCAIVAIDRQMASVNDARADLLDVLRSPDLFGKRHPIPRSAKHRLSTLRLQLRELQTHRTRLQLGAALPFRFASHFATAAADGGFPLVIGNPPWVRPHAIAARDRIRLRLEYRTLRDAAWRAGALRAGAATGFAAQADLSVAFVERSVQLLAPGGTLALLVPAKLWRALAGGGLRRFLHDTTDIREIHDWSDAPPLFDAATYPSLIVARRKLPDGPAHETDGMHRNDVTQDNDLAHGTPIMCDAHLTHDTETTRDTDDHHTIHVAVARKTRTHRFAIAARHLGITADIASPWLLLPPDARRTFHRIQHAGPALGDSPLGRPLLGVKCGCNAAFLVQATEHDDEMATVVAEGRRAHIERALLRPVLRGEAIGHAESSARDTHIVWTHARDGAPMRTLPPATNRWLSHWRTRLESRRDAHRRGPWWKLFRTEAARYDSPRLVWADIGKSLRTVVLPAGDPTVPLNTCYVLPAPAMDDAYALNALLTSPIAAAWLDCIAEPARGGFRRYMGWTIAAFPIPRDWLAVRLPLAIAGRRIATGEPPGRDEHIALVADAYGIPEPLVLPLLEWTRS